jgi:hypothetical protein
MGVKGRQAAKLPSGAAGIDAPGLAGSFHFLGGVDTQEPFPFPGLDPMEDSLARELTSE